MDHQGFRWRAWLCIILGIDETAHEI
jgi:hypothetical protein